MEHEGEKQEGRVGKAAKHRATAKKACPTDSFTISKLQNPKICD